MRLDKHWIERLFVGICDGNYRFDGLLNCNFRTKRQLDDLSLFGFLTDLYFDLEFMPFAVRIAFESSLALLIHFRA